MTIQPDDFSRFVGTDTVLFRGEEVWGAWNPPRFVMNQSDDQYTVIQVDKSQEGRPDLIAEEYYGTTLLDWVIIAYNKVTDTMNWPRAGDVIRVPNGDVASIELF